MQVIERLVGLSNLPEGNVLKPWRKTLYWSADILDFMSNLRLELPNISHKVAYLDMIEEWKNFETIPTSPRALFRGDTFEEFLRIAEADLTENHRWVPATLFFLMEWERILGGVQLRHSIDHPNLREFGGHIGYGIRPSERQKWYATEMLKLCLTEAQKLWLERVMIGCNDDNIGSKKTIEKNGGIFERYTEHDGKLSRVYWITLH